ncbi:uncharacterized [Tachysurus ichikawai]
MGPACLSLFLKAPRDQAGAELSSEPIHHGRHVVKGLPPAMRSGRRKSARECRVPSRSKHLFIFFLLTETLWTGRAFVTLSSPAFLKPPQKTSKRLLSIWYGRWPAKCCDRKMRCRSNGEKWNRRPLRSSHAN